MSIIKNKALKFRLFPNDSQEILIVKTFGCNRFYWNKALADNIAYYEETGKGFINTPAKYKKDYEWLKEVDSLSLANTQLNLQSAFRKFFKEKSVGFPKWKSKHHDKKSYTTNVVGNNIQFYGNHHIKLPKLGVVECRIHRIIPTDYKLKSCTISKSGSGKYYVSCLFEYEIEENKNVIDSNRGIGLDYSSHDLFVDSNGNSARYPRFYRQTETKLAREYRKLSKMIYLSNNWYKQKKKVALLQEKVANQRKDYLHKLSKKLATQYDYVVVENLNLQNIAQSLKLGKSTNDNGFGTLRNFLRYKLDDLGKQLIVINKWFPSTQTCSCCGSVLSKEDKLTLKDREWVCPHCGTFHDRDINAAKNILEEGKQILINRGNCGDSSLILTSLDVLSENSGTQKLGYL